VGHEVLVELIPKVWVESQLYSPIPELLLWQRVRSYQIVPLNTQYKTLNGKGPWAFEIRFVVR